MHAPTCPQLGYVQNLSDGAAAARSYSPRSAVVTGSTADEEASAPGVEVEVRLMSGDVLARLRLAADAEVRTVLQQSGAGAGSILLGGRVLQSGASLAQECVKSGDVLTFVRAVFSWDGARLGRLVRLDEDGRTAKRTASFGEALVIASYPSRFFRVRVIDSSAQWSGAMELGFTACCPVELPVELPRRAHLVHRSWVRGHSGCPYILGRSLEGEPSVNVDWGEGEIVVCSVTQSGELRIETRGQNVAVLPLEIPPDLVLYPLVNLYGQTTALELLDS